MKYDFVRETTACFTGHRALKNDVLSELRVRTAEAVSQAYENGYRTFLCGGARGFDTLAALEVIRFRKSRPDVRLVLAVPCRNQASRWSAEDRELWDSVCGGADDVIILSEVYYDGCMQARNRFMVDASSLCLCYMIRFQGGTWSTVRYALHNGLILKNLAMPDRPAAAMKERAWNYISISRSAPENANTVPLPRFRLQKTKKTLMSRRSFMRLS